MSSIPTGILPAPVKDLISSCRLFSQLRTKGVFRIRRGRPWEEKSNHQRFVSIDLQKRKLTVKMMVRMVSL